MKKIAVIFYGPPGSGKGTQANLLMQRGEVIHFDTGRFLEAIFYDPKRQHEKAVQREKKLFETGILITPSFVTGEIVKEVKRMAAAQWGLAFSGSPRTMYEAERVYPILEKLYGKKNIYVFRLFIPPADSIKRNSNRRICLVCGAIMLSAYHPMKSPKHCPVCAGPLYRRTLDKPEIIKKRLMEYRERTEPIFAYAKKRGHKIRVIDARPAPYVIYKKIIAQLPKH